MTDATWPPPGINRMAKLYATGMIQVALVTVQTWFIARQFWPGIGIVGFLISYVWTYNVKRIAVGCMGERVVYSAGAATGALGGLWIAGLFA